jgi:hypothetical protein
VPLPILILHIFYNTVFIPAVIQGWARPRWVVTPAPGLQRDSYYLLSYILLCPLQSQFLTLSRSPLPFAVFCVLNGLGTALYPAPRYFVVVNMLYVILCPPPLQGQATALWHFHTSTIRVSHGLEKWMDSNLRLQRCSAVHFHEATTRRTAHPGRQLIFSSRVRKPLGFLQREQPHTRPPPDGLQNWRPVLQTYSQPQIPEVCKWFMMISHISSHTAWRPH